MQMLHVGAEDTASKRDRERISSLRVLESELRTGQWLRKGALSHSVNSRCLFLAPLCFGAQIEHVDREEAPSFVPLDSPISACMMRVIRKAGKRAGELHY